MRVNVILDRILERDGEYQEIIRKSGEYLNKLEAMEQPKEARSLIDLHSCEQNALGARYGALAKLNRATKKQPAAFETMLRAVLLSSNIQLHFL